MKSKNKSVASSFNFYDNTIAFSFADKADDTGEIKSDLILETSDPDKMSFFLVQQMLRHPLLADIIWNAAFGFNEIQEKTAAQ